MAEDRFLSRWSRMKARARGGRASEPAERPRPDPAATAWRPHEPSDLAELEPEAAESAARETDQTSGRPDDPVDEAAVLAEWPEDLPHPDELDSESDYSRFFSPEVSEAVRNIALRRLWRSNPLYANVDGLVDYGEDFTDAATVIAGMKSAYQVGKGYAREIEEKLAEAEETLEPTEGETEERPNGEAAASAPDQDQDQAQSQAKSGEEGADDDRDETEDGEGGAFA